jgi:hypothetical protein
MGTFSDSARLLKWVLSSKVHLILVTPEWSLAKCLSTGLRDGTIHQTNLTCQADVRSLPVSSQCLPCGVRRAPEENLADDARLRSASFCARGLVKPIGNETTGLSQFPMAIASVCAPALPPSVKVRGTASPAPTSGTCTSNW